MKFLQLHGIKRGIHLNFSIKWINRKCYGVRSICQCKHTEHWVSQPYSKLTNAWIAAHTNGQTQKWRKWHENCNKNWNFIKHFTSIMGLYMCSSLSLSLCVLNMYVGHVPKIYICWWFNACRPNCRRCCCCCFWWWWTPGHKTIWQMCVIW